MKSIRLLTTWAVLTCGAGHAFAAPSQTAINNANSNASFLNGNSASTASTAGTTATASTASTTATASSIPGAASSSLKLAGQVGVTCTVSIAATPKAASLDPKGGEQNTSVGVVTETCNSGSGYTVSITSQNGGKLVSGDTSALYTASYDDATGLIASGLTATRNSAFFNRTGNLLINIPANDKAIAGNYADNITVVIAAK